jgi:hypothetical protein
MTAFLALYAGASVNNSEVLALTADPQIVRDFAGRMLDKPPKVSRDAAVVSIQEGQRKALEVVRGEQTA